MATGFMYRIGLLLVSLGILGQVYSIPVGKILPQLIDPIAETREPRTKTVEEQLLSLNNMQHMVNLPANYKNTTLMKRILDDNVIESKTDIEKQTENGTEIMDFKETGIIKNKEGQVVGQFHVENEWGIRDKHEEALELLEKMMENPQVAFENMKFAHQVKKDKEQK